MVYDYDGLDEHEFGENIFYHMENKYDNQMKAKVGMPILGEDATLDKDNLVSYSQQIKNIYHLWLIDDIDDNKSYLKWFDLLQSCTDDDLVVIHINCWGGSLFTAVQIVTQIKLCRAQVVCQIESACCSAATIIALACDGLVCYPHGYMMIHTSSGCAFGKQSDIKKEEEFYNPWLENLFNEIYKNFLSKKEIQQVLAGGDIWLRSDEIMERFNKKVEIINRENNRMKREHMKKLQSFMSNLQEQEQQLTASGVGAEPTDQSSQQKETAGKRKKPGKKRQTSTKSTSKRRKNNKEA